LAHLTIFSLEVGVSLVGLSFKNAIKRLPTQKASQTSMINNKILTMTYPLYDDVIVTKSKHKNKK
jgi:hypothetical protein